MDSPERLARGQATVAVHGPGPGTLHGTSTPVDRSAAFTLDGTGAGFAYSRTANPTVEAVAARIAALEHGESAALFASGSAALVAALLALSPPGGRIVAARELCGDTHRLLHQELPRLGRSVAAVPLDDRAGWRRAAAGASVLLVEGLSNPQLRVADVPALASVADAHGARLVVDATLATPVNLRPLASGADLVVHSATKALNGHSDLTAGVVAGPADLVAAVRASADWLGACLNPGAAALLERGLKTLPLRMERQNATALRVATWLAADPRVHSVAHPALPVHPDHELGRVLLRGSGGLVAFCVESDTRAAAVVAGLGLIRPLATLGGVESVAATVSTSHGHLDARARRAAGIPPGTVRLSLGIEDVDDLLADLDDALSGVVAGRPRLAAAS